MVYVRDTAIVAINVGYKFLQPILNHSKTCTFSRRQYSATLACLAFPGGVTGIFDDATAYFTFISLIILIQPFNTLRSSKLHLIQLLPRLLIPDLALKCSNLISISPYV